MSTTKFGNYVEVTIPTRNFTQISEYVERSEFNKYGSRIDIPREGGRVIVMARKFRDHMSSQSEMTDWLVLNSSLVQILGADTLDLTRVDILVVRDGCR